MKFVEACLSAMLHFVISIDACVSEAKRVIPGHTHIFPVRIGYEVPLNLNLALAGDFPLSVSQ